MKPRIIQTERLFSMLDQLSPGTIGITLYPYIILRSSWVKRKSKEAVDLTVNHEMIHIQQQAEMLVIFFYLWYLLEWVYRLLTVRKNSYYNISFEREAYRWEGHPDYLKTRPKWAWFKYLNLRKF